MSQPITARVPTEEAKITFRCLIALALVIIGGTIGFTLIEKDWGLWHSLFFTLITITTVGYGDQGLSPPGQMFAAVLLIFGIGTATYTLTSVVRIAADHNRIRRRRMRQAIDRLNGHTIVCGFGRIGMMICAELDRESLPFLVIEPNNEAYEKAVERGYLAIHGSADDDCILQEAGADRARSVVCATNSDAENVFITLGIREVNPQVFIACRASCESASRRMDHAGASLVVSPYTAAALSIVDALFGKEFGATLQNRRGPQEEQLGSGRRSTEAAVMAQ
jgi:voltage-gated potassium channel